MKTIKLQQIGSVNAKPAGELKVGDVTIWNFGSKAVVDSIVKETKKTVTLRVGGYERRFNKDRLVGVTKG